ncbi:JmjC domain-containing protein [Neisseria iguanae]|uniref:JmjC domain-containing protein n=1 Tax=Neisseria iguanae TaxID=90242 RepID=UPI001FE56816|nr:cupin domain-containing protein [Neisseria iguanae]
MFKFRKGALIPKEYYVEAFDDTGRTRHRFNKAAVYKYLKDGATLVYNRINNKPFTDNIARQVACFAHANTIVSGYFTFGEDASYKNHRDTRDVFAVQGVFPPPISKCRSICNKAKICRIFPNLQPPI